MIEMPYRSTRPPNLMQAYGQPDRSRMAGELLQNLGMGIMGLSLKQPQMAMQAFGRPLSDPRQAMMEAARLDMMTQEMAMRQQEAARKHDEAVRKAALHEAYLGGMSGPERLEAEIIGPAKHAAEMMELKNKPPGKFIKGPGDEWGINPLEMELREAGRPQTTVNVKSEGRLEPGQRAIRDDMGNIIRIENIPGGAPALKAAAEERAVESARETETAQAGNVLDAINQIRELDEDSFFPVTGLAGEIGKIWPGSPQSDTAELIKTVESKITRDAMTDLRKGSSTGATGLGAINQAELDMLRSSVASLKQRQSREQFFRNLDIVEANINRVVHGSPEHQARVRAQQRAAGGDATTIAPTPVDDLLDKYAPMVGGS